MANKNTMQKRAKLAKEIGKRRMEERAREKARRAMAEQDNRVK